MKTKKRFLISTILASYLISSCGGIGVNRKDEKDGEIPLPKEERCEIYPIGIYSLEDKKADLTFSRVRWLIENTLSKDGGRTIQHLTQYEEMIHILMPADSRGNLDKCVSEAELRSLESSILDSIEEKNPDFLKGKVFLKNQPKNPQSTYSTNQ